MIIGAAAGQLHAGGAEAGDAGRGTVFQSATHVYTNKIADSKIKTAMKRANKKVGTLTPDLFGG